MSNIVFSIITVVRNDKEGLEKTIASLKKQTYPYIEYIVIDGASTDGTLEFIRNNTAIISKWKSERDSGIYDAMNKGKNMAEGDFAVFINAGDVFFSTTALADIRNGMDNNLNMLYYGKTAIFNQDIEWEYKPYDNHPNQNYLPHHQATFYPAIFYKKESYDTHFKIMGDVDFTLRAVTQLQKKYIPVTVVRSELNGFSVNIYAKWKGIRLYIKDHQYFKKKYPARYSWAENIVIYAKAMVKYISFKIGGSYLINKMISARNENSKIKD